MFNSRADVDRHVQNCMKKVNNEAERNLRCLAFAKLYLKVGEYEQARRYISTYLSVKPHSAEAQLVLGEALEKLGKKEAALQAYRSSLEINPKQNGLLIKICELLSSDDVDFDQSYARYYCERAQSIDPMNPIVFNLKEKLVSSTSKDPKEISQLFLREIETRPNDLPMLGVRLLRHLLENSLINEAYEHILNFDRKNLNDLFSNNINWYETVANVLVKYQKENISTNLTWEYWMLSISTLNNLALLSLDERSINIKNTSDCISAVFNFDQSLKVATENIKNCPHKELTQEFLKHYQGQLCFHLATLIYKLAKVNSLKYKEALQMAFPLLFLAYHTTPSETRCMWLDHATETVRSQIQRWHREACFRCSQSGHILVAAAKDQQKLLIEKVTLECSGYWQEKLYKKIFVLREQQSKITSSFFATSSEIGEPTLRIPDLSEIYNYDEYAQVLYPDSLHHYIWIGMNQNLPCFKVSLFDGLQYSVRNLSNCAAESLNVLDLQSFVYSAILCAQSQIDDYKHTTYLNPNKPNILPAAVTDTLGTLNQAKWLQAAWKMYRNDYRSNFGELRLTLIRGIEVVRCVGNHGMDVKLMVLLARIFTDRSQNLTKQSEIEFNSARAEIYWKSALPILENLKNNQVVSYSPNKLFDFKSKEMHLNEILTYIESGKLFNGVQLMKKKEYEKSLQIFETLKDPYASFYQSQIYKALAEEQTSFNKENVTSEMRSQRITLLSHVRDYLYLTLDRLRDPTIDKKHPLNTQLATEIEKIDRLLSRIDPDVSNRNECDGMSDENSSYSSIPEHGFPNVSFTNGVSPKSDALLRVEASFRREARPSPERLDAQLRQLLASKDTAMHNILEQNKVMVDSHRALVDELRGFKEVVSNLSTTVNELKAVKHTVEELKGIKSSVDELKASVDELQNFRNVSDMVYEIKKELTELKKDSNKLKSNSLIDEDLYVLGDEYQDYGINSNVPNLNNLYSNISSRLPAAAAGNLYGAHPFYPGLAMGYPMLPYNAMGYAQPGSLPFPTDQQIPELRSLNPLPQQLNQSGLCQGLPQTGSNTFLHNNMNHPGLGQPLLVPPQTITQPTIFKEPTTASNLYLNLSQTSLTTTQISPLPIPSTSVVQPVCSRAPPVNVVITSSDPLPTTKNVTTPILSVSIPPQHLKGNISKTQPHSYQIPLPATSIGTTVTTPSVMNQTPLPVTTKNLLANVAAPIYSAIADKSTSEKNAGLGFHIEKTLSQSFNANSSSTDLNKSTSSTVSEEHDPCPDFKPIVPLPDEVPLTTGEEKEEVLFGERAKLFRFVNKEWRERGVGIIKILHNKESKKIRILMRRDQVHKVCANHFITEDMSLTQMPSSDCAYIWAAQDYADEKVVTENLCVKFKSPIEAQKFYDSFENAKRILVVNEKTKETTTKGIEHGTTTPTTEKIQPTTSLGGFVFTSTPTFKPKDPNHKPETASQPEPIKTSPFATFTFVKSPTISAPSAKTTLFSALKSTTTVEEIKQLDIKKAENSSNLPSKLVGSGDADESHVDEFVPTAEFKPVVPLPGLVEIKTGEENAEVLFEHKAKLLRFETDTKEWKERGVGIMKILKQNNLIRFVMRREQVHKVCCNHQLLKEMQFQKMSQNPKAVTWYAEDFSEGELKPEMFAIRFKTEELTNLFLDVVRKSQESFNNEITNDEISNKKCDKKSKPDTTRETISTSPVIKGFGDKFKPKSGSWECKNCYIVNECKVNYCVACETPKNETVPKKQPESGPQFSFGVKPSIQFSNANTVNEAAQSHFVFGPKLGTPASTSVTFHFGAASSPIISSQKVPSATASVGFGDAFKVQPGTWECSGCYIRNDADILYCISCNNPKDSTVPKKEDNIKGVNLDTPGLTYSFGVPPSPNISSQNVPSSTSVGFGDAFKAKPGTWECSDCYIRNETDNLYCISCNNPKDSTVPKKEDKIKGVNLDTPGLTFNFGIKPNTTTKTSEVCDVTKSELSFKFGMNNTPTTTTTGFSIKDADSTTNDVKPLNLTSNAALDFKASGIDVKNTEPNKNETTQKFVFGSPQTHNFEFTPRSPRRQSGGHGEEESDGSYVEEECDNIYFKPVIPMPDKVDVQTGEEQEDVLYCHRAKLFRFKDSEWKERGIGDIKVLYKKDTNKLRVLMRREKILKICLNHILTKDIEYISKDDKTWLFAAADFSDGEIERDQFCLRFKTADVAQEFKVAIDNALKKASNSDTVVPKCAESNDPDVEFVSETTVTAEEEEEAIKLGLPPKFFAYRQLQDCNCDQCKREDEMFKGLLDSTQDLKLPKPETPKSTISTFTFTLPKTEKEKTASGLFGTSVIETSENVATSLASNTTEKSKENIFSATIGNVFGDSAKTFTTSASIFNTSSLINTNNIFGAKTPESSKASTVTTTNQILSKPTTSTTTNVFSSPISSNNSFFNKSNSENLFTKTPTAFESIHNKTNTSVTTPAFGNKSSPIFGSANTPSLDSNKPNSIFGPIGSGDASKFTSTVSFNDNEPILKCDSNLSFASLINQNTEAKFATIQENEKNPFASLGAGAPVFGSKTTKASQQKQAQKSDDEADETTEDYDPHYEPIVPLPDAIIVTTGEEDETSLFNERAKVYRFDGKEWKERGVGQLKILHHPEKNTYRLLLRREQVHKVVLNQLITLDLNMQPMSTSEKAWLWGGYNFSEDELVLEKLAARFKNISIAKEFYNVIQEVISRIKEHDSKNIPKTVENIGVEEISDYEEHASEEEVEDEEDDEYDDDERSIMFSKTCKFSRQLPSGEWQETGIKDIQIYYDSDFYGSRISVADKTGLQISNTVIGINTVMHKNNLSCTWKAVEWANDIFEWENLRATFDSTEECHEFYASYEEGVGYAQHSEIVDEIPTIEAE